MGNSKNLIFIIIIVLLILVGLVVAKSIWSSLQDTKAKLEAQKREMEKVKKDNETLAAVRDSLHRENSKLTAQEQRLLGEKNALREELRQLRIQHQKDMARIDKLWEAKSIIAELDTVFPEWAGLFWQAKTPNGLEGMIAPRFFSNQVLEILAEREGSKAELQNCNQQVANRDSVLDLKEKWIGNLQNEVVALDTTYKTLFGKYNSLDSKYKKEVKNHWFKLTVGNAVTFGAGLGLGFLVGKH